MISTENESQWCLENRNISKYHPLITPSFCLQNSSVDKQEKVRVRFSFILGKTYKTSHKTSHNFLF